MSKNIAIIGYGAVGKRHARALREAGANVVAVVGRSQETKARLRRDFAIPVFHTTSALFREVPLDGVVISSPNYTHCDYTIEALQNGCHVLCEKPMATNRQDALRMWNASVHFNKCLMMAFNLRYLAHSREAFKICRSGRIGQIYHAKCEWLRSRGIPGFGKWFTEKKKSGGGALIDSGIHVLDFAWHLMGSPAPVSALGATYGLFQGRLNEYSAVQSWSGSGAANGAMDVEDFCAGIIRFENGATLQLTVSWAANVDEIGCHCLIFGDKGGLHWTKEGNLAVFNRDAVREIESTFARKNLIFQRFVSLPLANFFKKNFNFRNHIDPGDPLIQSEMHRHFLACTDGERCLSGADEGYVVQCMVDAIYESAEKSCEVKVGADAFS